MHVLVPYWRFEVNMIAIDIPGWGNLNIENAVSDLNGTLAKDGKILTPSTFCWNPEG
jgi:hypothetical protein